MRQAASSTIKSPIPNEHIAQQTLQVPPYVAAAGVVIAAAWASALSPQFCPSSLLRPVVIFGCRKKSNGGPLSVAWRSSQVSERAPAKRRREIERILALSSRPVTRTNLR
jgi:hypothetical protein